MNRYKVKEKITYNNVIMQIGSIIETDEDLSRFSVYLEDITDGDNTHPKGARGRQKEAF